MERKILGKLRTWKESINRKPLLIKGARQVGKTYSALTFGKEEYQNTAYVNLEASGSARDIFSGDLDVKRMIRGISAFTGETVSEGDTLIILDEVQTSERALTAMKYFQENSEHHIIATGSLLGMTLNRNEYSFPVGKVDMMTMYPMDLEEYMWATGEERTASLIRSSFDDKVRMPLHERSMNIFRSYLAVGGMPESVSEHIRTDDHDFVISVQNRLNDSYVADMAKYAVPSETVRAMAVWSSIPSQLARENRKFQYSSIKAGARSRDYEASITWLETAGVINVCNRVTDGKLPLNIYEDTNSFKTYMMDTGLLTSSYGMPIGRIMDGTGSNEMRGALAENYVMQSMVSNSIEPYYWSSPGKAELDFLYQDAYGNIIPVEVKSSDKTRSKSLSLFTSRYDVPYSIRISSKNIGFENGILSIPLYAAFCIEPTMDPNKDP